MLATNCPTTNSPNLLRRIKLCTNFGVVTVNISNMSLFFEFTFIFQDKNSQDHSSVGVHTIHVFHAFHINLIYNITTKNDITLKKIF